MSESSKDAESPSEHPSLYEQLAENRARREQEFQERYGTRNNRAKLSEEDQDWLKKVQQRKAEQRAIDEQVAKTFKNRNSTAPKRSPVRLPVPKKITKRGGSAKPCNRNPGRQPTP